MGTCFIGIPIFTHSLGKLQRVQRGINVWISEISPVSFVKLSTCTRIREFEILLMLLFKRNFHQNRALFIKSFYLIMACNSLFNIVFDLKAIPGTYVQPGVLALAKMDTLALNSGD